MIVAEPLTEISVLPNVNVVIPCEMADPASYSSDGRRAQSFHPCGAAAQWRLVLRRRHSPSLPDEHLLCDRHLGVWQTFRAVENPSWDISLPTRL